MKKRERATTRRPLDSAVRAFVLLAVFLSAISSANAQSGSGVEGGPAAPATEKADPPPAPAQEAKPPDGFTVGGFVFKPGGRAKLDIIRDFNPITSEDSFDPRTIP